MPASPPSPAAFRARRGLAGRVAAPGDGSIALRALILGALAVGTSRVEGVAEGEDIRATIAALRAMGATIAQGEDGAWTIDGVGVGGLDMGAAGAALGLLLGVVASHPITATFIGDAALSQRPMARIIEPLALMGADFTTSPGGRLPLMARGLCPAVPIDHRLALASAPVKSAILLAGLNTPGITRVIEPRPTADHSERMLARFGADLAIEEDIDGTRTIALTGEAELRPQHVAVPGDPALAAYAVVAALLVPGSEIVIENVGLDATRASLFTLLRQMGGAIAFENMREAGGEPVGDLRVGHSPLGGIELPPETLPGMIDECPILFVAAALAEGHTVMRGLAEVRATDRERIATMAEGLRAIGARIEDLPDGLAIEGTGGAPLPGGATVRTGFDHRVAMSFAVAGLVSAADVTIDDMAPATTRFPGFAETMTSLGAEVAA